MGHLLKLNTHIQMHQVRILASTAVPFRLATNLALIEAKRITLRPRTAETFKIKNLKNNFSFHEPMGWKRNRKKKDASHAPSCISRRLFL
jgi:hypothetical protein